MSNQHEANFGDRPPSVEQILGNLKPEVLEISREELFFQAGFAAGAAAKADSNLRRYFCPALAAALLVACVGLGATAAHQAAAVDGLKVALAAVQENSRGDQGLQENKLRVVAAKPQAEGTRTETQHESLDLHERQLRRLASSARMPPGRLTAMGWTQGGREMGSGEWGMGNAQAESREDSDDGSDQDGRVKPASHSHPATYLELLRLEQEG